MLVPFRDVLAEARARGTAAGAFTCYDLQAAGALLDTAAVRDRAVVLLVSPGTVRDRLGEASLAALLAFADRSDARVCVQVDHVQEIALVERVLALGVGAVMVDGARLPLEQNIDLVRAAVELADAAGAAIEAEIGHIEGDEDLAAAVEAGRLTDPDDAVRLTAECDIACLAVSIGNVHGHYAAPPVLDWNRLEDIRRRVPAPLALHGASGIPDPSIRRAVRAGIGKINTNTELREAYLAATSDAIGTVRETAAVVDLQRAQTAAMAAVVAGKLELYEAEAA